MRALLTLIMCAAAAFAAAEPMHAFKAVHADGTVVYSDTRPVESGVVEEVTIYESSAAIEQQGKQRQQEMDAAAESLEKQRQRESDARREYQKRVAEAQQEVANAERGLVTVQQSKKNATPERIAAARDHLRLARQRLRELQSAGP